MQSGRYRVYAGDTPLELIDVNAAGRHVNIDGPIWTGSGLVLQGTYCGTFVDREGGGRGNHRATTTNVANNYDVDVEFECGLTMRLQWRLES